MLETQLTPRWSETPELAGTVMIRVFNKAGGDRCLTKAQQGGASLEATSELRFDGGENRAVGTRRKGVPSRGRSGAEGGPPARGAGPGRSWGVAGGTTGQGSPRLGVEGLPGTLSQGVWAGPQAVPSNGDGA